MQCARKRAFRDIDRETTPDRPWNAGGTRMHGHLEKARQTGEMPPQDDPEARVASAAMQYWPERPWDPEVAVYVDRGDFAWKGYSDQFGPAFVGDYKFTGNKKNIPGYIPRIKNWDLINAAGERLVTDVQWAMYGKAASNEAPQAPHVDGQWTYIVKPPKMIGEPTVLPVRLRQSHEAVERTLSYFDIFARHLIETRAAFTRANDVPHSADRACGGVSAGCDFAHLCEITNPGKTEIMATLDDLFAENEIEETANEAPPAEAPAPKGKKKAPKKAATPKAGAVSLSGQIVSASLGGVLEISLGEGDFIVPVGARVKIEVDQ